MIGIVTVVAVATSVPTSATVVYSKVMRGVNSDNLFTVSSSGAINVVGVLDREAESTYDIQVQVSTRYGMSLWLINGTTYLMILYT